MHSGAVAAGPHSCLGQHVSRQDMETALNAVMDRLPNVRWDPTKPNNYGFDLENYGVAPDVWVKNSPADDAKGIDRELKAAIDEAMKMLKAGPRIPATDKGGKGGR